MQIAAWSHCWFFVPKGSPWLPFVEPMLGHFDLTLCRYFLQTAAGDAEVSDLEPGVLSQELQAALGLDPEDPPPWLHRMRQMGYPPGYRSAILLPTCSNCCSLQLLFSISLCSFS